jgi:hypothetical protein
VDALKKLVAFRRITFEHDIYGQMICNSTATASDMNSMPACPNVVFPTPNPDGKTYWPE